MVKTEKENDKPEKESGKPDNASTQQEIEQPKPLKEGKAAGGTGDVAVSPGNVVHDVAVNAKNACNSGQSKVKKSREKENKELPPQPPPRGRKDGGSCFSLHTGIRFQYNDAQLSGTDGYAPKIGD